MRISRATGIALLGSVVLAASVARAAPPEVRLTGIHRLEGRLRVSVGVPDIISEEAAQRLTSGFATRVLISVAVFREGSNEPVAQTYRLSEIVYDLWDEKFRVRSSTPGAPVLVKEAPSAEAAIALAATLVQFSVVDLAALAPGANYRLSVRADLNPLSQDVVNDVRRWLARPPGQGRLAPGDSFFGSFVSIFVNPRIEESERAIHFVSQTFVARP